jgi:hypothetical protein
MARRHLTITLPLTLDDDACRADDTPTAPDGDSRYSESIDLLRTAIQHHTAIILAPYDPEFGPPDIEYTSGTHVDHVHADYSDGYKRARGAIKGTMPAEEAIRRTRGHDLF